MGFHINNQTFNDVSDEMKHLEMMSVSVAGTKERKLLLFAHANESFLCAAAAARFEGAASSCHAPDRASSSPRRVRTA